MIIPHSTTSLYARARAHAHALSLSLSLSHTHTHTHTQAHRHTHTGRNARERYYADMHTRIIKYSNAQAKELMTRNIFYLYIYHYNLL